MDIIWASGAQDLGSIPSEATKKRQLIFSCLFLMPPTPITIGFRTFTFLFTRIEVFEIIGKSYFNKINIKTKILDTHFPSLEINKNTIDDIEYLFKKEKIYKKIFHTKKRLPS